VICVFLTTFSMQAILFIFQIASRSMILSAYDFITASSSTILSAYEFTTLSSCAILVNHAESPALSSHRFTNSVRACERVTNQRKYINMKIRRQHKIYAPQVASRSSSKRSSGKSSASGSRVAPAKQSSGHVITK
jgi:hypothetical protein